MNLRLPPKCMYYSPDQLRDEHRSPDEGMAQILATNPEMATFLVLGFGRDRIATEEQIRMTWYTVPSKKIQRGVDKLLRNPDHQVWRIYDGLSRESVESVVSDPSSFEDSYTVDDLLRNVDEELLKPEVPTKIIDVQAIKVT